MRSLSTDRSNTVSVGQLVVDQLVVRATGRTALGPSFMKPEPHDRSVVLLTETPNQPLVPDAGHNVRVLLGSSVRFRLQYTVRVLSLLQSLQGPSLESSGLF